MTTIDHRVLMPTSLNKLFFEQRIFVSVNNMFNTSTINLGITIPGEAEETQSKVRDELCSYLQRSLIGIDDEWVIAVKINHELDPAVPVIAVEINNPQWMDCGSEDLVLDAVRVFMTVKAKQMYRQLTIIGAHQLLVPLYFEYQDILNSFVTLQLPQGLLLASSFGRDVEPSQTESYDVACDLLRETIQAALRSKGFDLRFLNLAATRNGLRLEVDFDGVNPPKSWQLNMFETIVANMFSTHCRYSSVYELTFQSTSRHYAAFDDGYEPVERYDEY